MITQLKVFFFCSLVHPILEYGTELWDPSTTLLVTRLKKSKESYFIILPINLIHPVILVTTQLILSLESLADRRNSTNMSFISNHLSF